MDFSFPRVTAVLAATVALAFVGCSSTRYERSTGEFVDDTMLKRRVSYALDTQPVYKFPDVKVHTYRGIVQLGGFVATDAQRQAATEIAQRVRGVELVENAISVAPLADNTLRNFIPGRQDDTNQVNRAVGAPARDVNVQRSEPVRGNANTNSASPNTLNNMRDRNSTE